MKTTNKSRPLSTRQHFIVLLDQLTGHILDHNKLKAEQAIKIDQVKNDYAVKIGGESKVISNLKTRLKNFAEKYGSKLFATADDPKKETGILNTNRSVLKVKTNPPSIAKIDKKEADEDLIHRAKKLGFGNLVVTEEKLSIEAMEKLTDQELDRIGYQRISDKKTITFEVQADPKLKQKETIESQGKPA